MLHIPSNSPTASVSGIFPGPATIPSQAQEEPPALGLPPPRTSAFPAGPGHRSLAPCLFGFACAEHLEEMDAQRMRSSVCGLLLSVSQVRAAVSSIRGRTPRSGETPSPMPPAPLARGPACASVWGHSVPGRCPPTLGGCTTALALPRFLS